MRILIWDGVVVGGIDCGGEIFFFGGCDGEYGWWLRRLERYLYIPYLKRGFNSFGSECRPFLLGLFFFSFLFLSFFVLAFEQ